MKELPITVKRSIELIGICALIFIVSSARDIITPLLMAFFLSILLLPIFRFFKKIKFPDSLAILFTILSGALVLGGIIWFFTYQISTLLNDLPEIQKNLNLHWKEISSWINSKTKFSSRQQLDWLMNQSDSLLGNMGSYLSGAALSLTSVFIFVGLLPIYIFLILFYKNLLLRFVFLWFKPAQDEKIKKTLIKVEDIVKSYLIGLMIQVAYVTILLGGLLMVLGIKHAILIGVIFAILNLIPYVGALVGNIIGVLLTLTSSQDLMPIVTVLLSIGAVQFLDNNILMPRIVGSKVKLNALASVVGVIIGGTIAGISGMFLSLPVMAVLKIIFDNSVGFKQWGFLLGDEKPKVSPMKEITENS